MSDKSRSTIVVRYLDVVLVAIAAPVALALGAPALGCVIGVVAWIAQRVLGQLDRRFISTSAEPRRQLGLNLAEAFGRIWLLVGAIVIAGVLGGRADGLTAAVVIFCAYSVAFAIRVLSGPPNRREGDSALTAHNTRVSRARVSSEGTATREAAR